MPYSVNLQLRVPYSLPPPSLTIFSFALCFYVRDKMPKRKCRFSVALQRKYTCFRRGRDDFEGECMVCRPGTFVSVAHKGGRDLQSHMDSEKHKIAIRGEASSAKLTNVFVKPCSKWEDEVTAAEGAFAFHTVKHHHSYNVMTCTSGLLKTMFPDSDIARKFSSAKTKTEAIVNSVLAPDCLDNVLKSIEENEISYCGVSADVSNHGPVKVVAVVIQYFDWKSGGLQSKIIEMQSQPNEDSILSYVKATLESKGLLKKCIAFTGDNCNAVFGGTEQNSEGRNVFAKVKSEPDNKTFIGLGCPAQILNNCVHQAADALDVDVESIIFKMYQYFNIYRVRTEQLKEYCEFVDIEYRKLISHSKTCWLSSFPGITRLLHVFPAVKEFFLSQSKPPTVLQEFFEHELSEAYLLHLQSLMSMFHSYILELERENNSAVEILQVLLCVQNMLAERKNNSFMSLKVKSLLKEKRADGLGAACDKFCAEVSRSYDSCIDYLEKCMEPLKEFSCFMWMSLGESLEWDRVGPSLKFLQDRDVTIDKGKCFDQFCNLEKFVDHFKGDDEFIKLQAHQKWTRYFEASKNIMCHSELLKIAQGFFAIASRYANAGAIFSLSKERGNLSLDSLRSMVLLQYNCKHITCKEFHAYLLSNKQLLNKIRSTEKYAWARQRRTEEQSASESVSSCTSTGVSYTVPMY